MKNRLLALSLISFISMVIILPSSYAADLIQDISAQVNQNVTILWDNAVFIPTDASGKNLQPILFENSVYVPLRSFGLKSGCAVNWDPSTSTVNITSPVVPAIQEEPAVDQTANQQTPEATEDQAAGRIILNGEQTTWPYWIINKEVYMEYHDTLALVRSCTKSRVYTLNYSPTSQILSFNDQSEDIEWKQIGDYKVINVFSVERYFANVTFSIDTTTGVVTIGS